MLDKGADSDVWLGLAFVVLLVPVTLIDLDHQIIPNTLMIIGTVVSVGLLLLTDPRALTEHLIAAAAAGGFLFIAALAYPGGHGHGRRQARGRHGPLPGPQRRPRVARRASSPDRSSARLIIATKGVKAGRKTAIPFGPYLALGGLVGLFAGDAIVDWYLDTFL